MPGATIFSTVIDETRSITKITHFEQNLNESLVHSASLSCDVCHCAVVSKTSYTKPG